MRCDPASVTARPRAAQETLAERAHHLLAGSPYVDYLYSYPHKTAHRPLHPPIPLETLWSKQEREALFLYLHVPFCSTRCGYCNLFTQVSPASDRSSSRVDRYVAAVERQLRTVAQAIAPARFARLAIGGGTPSLLSTAQLTRLFDQLEAHFAVCPKAIPTSFELAPDSTSDAHVALLAERGVQRVSIGVQSFLGSELVALGRRQEVDAVRRALDRLRASAIPRLNIDLIYGMAEQTPQSFEHSLREALRWQPEELFLYPLYVRPLTGLDRRAAAQRESTADWDARRLSLYRLGRDLLRTEGYRQHSMRSYRRATAEDHETSHPAYRCQEDGMVGLGCGARSYTEGLHYSSEYAVGARGVAAIVEAWSRREARAFAHADHGVVLEEEDRRRRYVIMSLLTCQGLELAAYGRRFATDALVDVPELASLVELELATLDAGELRLTSAGLERSDAIGPFLRSARVDALMRDYTLR